VFLKIFSIIILGVALGIGIWQFSKIQPAPNLRSPSTSNINHSLQQYQDHASGITLSYPSSWGQVLASGGRDSFCSLALEFSVKSTVIVCASTITDSQNCASNGPCQEVADPQTWMNDKQELQTLRPGQKCSHLSLAGCAILSSDTGNNMMLYYDYRPERKTYVQYRSKYRIEAVFDVADEFAEKYRTEISSEGVIAWLTQGRPPAEVTADVGAFDSMAKSIQGN